jgi:hypothetical protein
LDFPERYECKPVLLRLSLAENLDEPIMSLYETEWRERGYGLWWKVSGTGSTSKVWRKYIIDKNGGKNCTTAPHLKKKTCYSGKN